MDVFPKFIIEGDSLIIGKVTYHKQLITEPDKVRGGGWFRYLQHTDTFVFYGSSHDLGTASFEDIKRCVEQGKVFKHHRDDSLTEQHHFAYDTQTEIIPLGGKILNSKTLTE